VLKNRGKLRISGRVREPVAFKPGKRPSDVPKEKQGIRERERKESVERGGKVERSKKRSL